MKPKTGDIIVITDATAYTDPIRNGDIVKLDKKVSDMFSTDKITYFEFKSIQTKHPYDFKIIQTLIPGTYKISIYHRMKMLIEKHKR